MSITKWDNIHTIMISSGIVLVHITGYMFIVVIPAIFSLAFLWIMQWNKMNKLNPPGGLANLITTFRFLLIITTALISINLTNSLIGILFLINILLDVIDGFIARKRSQITETGKYLDLESDALFVALASMIIFDRNIAEIWILIPGYMRYFYVLLILILNKKPEEKKTKFGSVAAGVMFVCLVSAYFLPEKPSVISLASGSVLILISFMKSFWMALK